MLFRSLLTPWWRLLLAICVVAVPAATTASFDAGMWRHAARHPAQMHAHPGRVVGAGTSRLSTSVEGAGHHVAWPAAAVLGTAVVLTWWALGVVRRRSGRALGQDGQLARSRSPPSRAEVSVRSGSAPGIAWRFSRRSNARFRLRVGTANA